MILISNDRTSTSKKINGMTLIRTLMVSTTAFERTKEKFYGFWQAVLVGSLFKVLKSKISGTGALR